MKKIINGKKYDTDTARIVGEYYNGHMPRDFEYLEEHLYQKKTGEFFLHGEGGPMTRYAERVGDMWGYGEKIMPLDDGEAREWAEKHLSADEVEEIFGEVSEGSGDPAARATEIRKRTGMNMTRFAEKYGIPYRTVQNWESGVTAAPEYVLDMLAKVVATDTIKPYVWVVETYRDKAGTGSVELFESEYDAVYFAMKEWDHMSSEDRSSYLDDPAGVFCAGLKAATWEDIAEVWVTDSDFEEIAWDALAK